MSKKCLKKMEVKLDDFKPGDIVRVKTLEELEKEFSKNDDGDYSCGQEFFVISAKGSGLHKKGMENFCGKEFAIQEFKGGFIRLIGDALQWAFTPEMVILVKKGDKT